MTNSNEQEAEGVKKRPRGDDSSAQGRKKIRESSPECSAESGPSAARDPALIELLIPNSTKVERPTRMWPNALNWRFIPDYYNNIFQNAQHYEWLSQHGLLKFAQLSWTAETVPVEHIIKFVRSFDSVRKTLSWNGNQVKLTHQYLKNSFHIEGEVRQLPKPPKDWELEGCDTSSKSPFNIGRMSDDIRQRVQFLTLTVLMNVIRSDAPRYLLYAITTNTMQAGWAAHFADQFLELIRGAQDKSDAFIELRLRPHIQILFDDPALNYAPPPEPPKEVERDRPHGKKNIGPSEVSKMPRRPASCASGAITITGTAPERQSQAPGVPLRSTGTPNSRVQPFRLSGSIATSTTEPSQARLQPIPSSGRIATSTTEPSQALLKQVTSLNPSVAPVQPSASLLQEAPPTDLAATPASTGAVPPSPSAIPTFETPVDSFDVSIPCTSHSVTVTPDPPSMGPQTPAVSSVAPAQVFSSGLRKTLAIRPELLRQYRAAQLPNLNEGNVMSGSDITSQSIIVDMPPVPSMPFSHMPYEQVLDGIKALIKPLHERNLELCSNIQELGLQLNEARRAEAAARAQAKDVSIVQVQLQAKLAQREQQHLTWSLQVQEAEAARRDALLNAAALSAELVTSSDELAKLKIKFAALQEDLENVRTVAADSMHYPGILAFVQERIRRLTPEVRKSIDLEHDIF